VNNSNVQAQTLIRLCPLTQRALLCRVEAGTGHTEHAAHQGDRKHLTVRLDAGVLHRDSLAKYAAAFF
jgi:hypothetical protein